MYEGLVFAGTDTSSHTAAMALYNLALNPDIKVLYLIYRINYLMKLKIW